jgi:LmbE family N-acetylglucosaminyl deacetylase
VTDLGTILCVWAHPDDETYLSGGLLAAASRAGRRAVCVIATRGEAGTPDPDAWPPERLAALRTTEMDNALAALGDIELVWLDYPDGGCAGVPYEEAVQKLAAIMSEVGPDTVLTFGPDAMTGHSDHAAVCAWSTAAFERAGPPGSRLLYASVTREWTDEYVPVLAPFNVYEPGYPKATEVKDIVLDFELSDELMDAKMNAIRAHSSQSQSLFDVLGEDIGRIMLRREFYRLGAQKPLA